MPATTVPGVALPPVPPGWPRAVQPPGTPEWEQSAASWLLDLCPPDYRALDVLRRYPVVLARFAAHCVEAQVEASRRGFATARAELRDLVPPEALAATMAAYEREGARLVATGREVRLVREALEGGRWVPRL